MSAMSIEDFGAMMLADVEAEGLRRLASIALRRMRAEVDAIMRAGIARLARAQAAAGEADRVTALLLAATPPEAMVQAPVAPARGPMRLVPEYELSKGGIPKLVSQHWRGLDQLSVMCRQARARYDRDPPRNAKGEPLPFVAPFTPGQIAMAQHYQALVERHDAAGMRGASVEVRAAVTPGGGQGGGFIEAYLSEGREIDMIRRRIGDGLALEVQRGKGKRSSITVRRLVDMVVLGDADLTAVLRAHGWAKDAVVLRRLRDALAEALDHMQGYPKKGA